MKAAPISRLAAASALGCSALAFVLVMANIILGVPPEADENASAHIWQLLVVSQLSLMLLFLVTADWRSPGTHILLAVQLLALTAACVPVFIAGY